MEPVTYLLLSLSILTLIAYLYLIWNQDYWKKRGIPFVKPELFFGTMKQVMLGKRHMAEVFNDIYWKYPESPLVGFFSFLSPTLLIRDPEIIKEVMVKSFSSFQDNDFANSDDPIFKYNPFVLKGERWKKTRARLSPAFSSGKLKILISNMNIVGEDLISYISKNKDSLEAKELSAKFTTDVIALCIFGVKGNSFVHENAEFRQMGKEIMGSESAWLMLKFNIIFLAPTLAKILRLRLVSEKVESFFKNLVREAINYRQSNKIERNDFLQLLVSLNENNQDFDEEELISHSILFFTDGFETSSGTLAFALYLLAMNPDKQEKAQEEIDRIWKKHGGLTWEALSDTHYVECCLLEALRLYPPASVLRKSCTKKYELNYGNGKTLITNPNLSIVIPLYSLHYDPKYFKNPKEYIPERHFEEEKSPNYRYTFLPFGEGPRQCIGIRLALAQTKVGLCTILRNYNIIQTKATPKTFEIDPRQVLLNSRNPLIVGFEKR